MYLQIAIAKHSLASETATVYHLRQVKSIFSSHGGLQNYNDVCWMLCKCGPTATKKTDAIISSNSFDPIAAAATAAVKVITD